jgi:hypothetical protein
VRTCALHTSASQQQPPEDLRVCVPALPLPLDALPAAAFARPSASRRRRWLTAACVLWLVQRDPRSSRCRCLRITERARECVLLLLPGCTRSTAAFAGPSASRRRRCRTTVRVCFGWSSASQPPPPRRTKRVRVRPALPLPPDLHPLVRCFLLVHTAAAGRPSARVRFIIQAQLTEAAAGD